MRLNFSSIPLKNRAFSDKPMTFIEQGAKNFLAAIIDLVAIETGNRVAREHWQERQLQNLLTHAAQRSAFWRRRIGARKASELRLSDLPRLTRADVVNQVETEGSLLRANEQIRVLKHSTSGSTGKPVEFFLTERNNNYNLVRSAAQFFMEGRDLSLNRTRFRPERMSKKNGFRVQKGSSWLEPLETLVRTGINKHVEYFHPSIDALCKELEADPIGYLNVQPRLIEMMLQDIGPEFFKQAGTAMLIPLSEALDPKLRETFAALNIPVRGNYSSEEVGLIGSECEKAPGFFHVATSGVIVEVVTDDAVQLHNMRLGQVLVTLLHSYATPFIRYDLGDVATLDEGCVCGHDGPVLSNVYGRAKSFLKHADGRISVFFPRGKELTAIARFDEYRIRQVDIENIVVEIGGRESLSPRETAAFATLIKSHAGDEFYVEVRAVREIDWGLSTKRLGFSSDVWRS